MDKKMNYLGTTPGVDKSGMYPAYAAANLTAQTIPQGLSPGTGVAGQRQLAVGQQYATHPGMAGNPGVSYSTQGVSGMYPAYPSGAPSAGYHPGYPNMQYSIPSPGGYIPTTSAYQTAASQYATAHSHYLGAPAAAAAATYPIGPQAYQSYNPTVQGVPRGFTTPAAMSQMAQYNLASQQQAHYPSTAPYGGPTVPGGPAGPYTGY